MQGQVDKRYRQLKALNPLKRSLIYHQKISDLTEGRIIAANSSEIMHYGPVNPEIWENAYKEYLRIL